MPLIDLKKVNKALIKFNSLNDSEKKEFFELLERRKGDMGKVYLKIKKRKSPSLKIGIGEGITLKESLLKDIDDK